MVATEANNFIFSDKSFNTIFPFYLLVDEKLNIISVGEKLNKICPVKYNVRFFEYFSIVRPQTAVATIEDLAALQNQLVIIKSAAIDGKTIRGQWVFIEDKKQFLFIGTPWFNSMDEVKALNLSINDFPIHDSMIDLLHILKAQEIASTDMKALLFTINKQKNNLRTAQYETSVNAQRLELLIANLQTGILLEDENRKIIDANQMFCDMFGIVSSPGELKGMDCSNSAEQSKNFFKNPQGFVSRIDEVLKHRKPIVNDVLELVDGRFFERDYVPIFIENNYKGHLWQYRDITKAKRNEADLQKRLSMVAEASENGIIFTNTDGLITWANDGFLRLSEYELEEVIGNTPVELFNGPQTDKDILQRIAEAFSDGVNFEEEIIHHRKDGSWFWAKTKGQAIIGTDGKPENFFTIIEDISHRKFATQWLQAQEEKYRSIISNMNLGLIEVDNEANILFVNKSFCNMCGYTREELIGANAQKLFANDDYTTILLNRTDISSDSITDASEINLLNKEGQLKWWFVSGAPLYNDKSEKIGSIGIHLDITEQKNTQDELVKAKRNAELASDAKQSFLANMSHEIRTPLNAIMGLSRQLQKSTLPDNQKLQVDTIYGASENLLTIINEILDLSKVEAGKLSIENIAFNIRDAIENSQRVIKHKAEEKGLRINLLIEHTIAEILIGDPYRLNQILLNLLSNAIKFTEKGSIRVLCVLKDEAYGKQHIEISVIDTGIGMSKEYIENIFGNFTQEDASISRLYGGSGLGMSITKNLVELMGGEIYVESEKNAGTTITVVIPFKVGTTDDLPVEEQVDVDLELFKNKKILIVDDNEYNRLVAKTTLEYYGSIIEESDDGRDAIEKTRKHNYDIILMDLRMPEVDGIEATHVIRTEINTKVPIIALTANVVQGENEKCLDAGMNDFIVKPFVEEQFIATIARWLEKVKHVNGKSQVKGLKGISLNGNSGLVSPVQLYSLDEVYAISRDKDGFVEKMVNIFINQLTTCVGDIITAHKNGDLEKIKFNAHRLKPSITSMRIASLTNEIREMESFTDAVDSPRMAELVALLNAVTSEVVADMRAQFPEKV